MIGDIREIRPNNDDDMRALGHQDAIANEACEWAERRAGLPKPYDPEIGDIVRYDGQTYEVGHVRRDFSNDCEVDENGRAIYRRGPAIQLRLQDPLTHIGTLKVSPAEVTPV